MNELDESKFSDATATGAVLVDFAAEWCGPCKAILPTLNRLASEYSGRMSFYSVDIDKSPALAAKHGVMSVPTLLLLDNGKVVDRIIGAASEKDLRKRIETQLNG